MLKYKLSLLTLLVLTGVAAAVPSKLKIFPGNGQVQFNLDYAPYSVLKILRPLEGNFERFQGTMEYDPDNLSGGSISWVVQVGSINTGIPERDRHLATADYFDAEQYPTIAFSSDSVRVLDSRHLQVSGRFSMRGVIRKIEVPVVLEDKTFHCRFSILRSEYNFSAGLPAIADRVNIHLIMFPSQSWFPVSSPFPAKG